MIRLPVVIFYCLLCSFIQVDKKPANTQELSFLKANDLKITVNYFDEKSIPYDIAGDCSERYAFDTLMLHANKMVLFTDLGSVAIMKINYQLIHFKFDRAEVGAKQTTHIYSGEGYTIRFTSKQIKKLDDEYFVHSGTLEISKNGQKKIYYVLGKYGC
ncbi:MAG: hypothetical protein JWQ30_225 [Sediminibacterium sp.]|nr:hypothetical protein [Sediminibacterium sp.]